MNARLLYGTEEAVAPSRRLTAGPLSAALDGGNLRDIRVGGVEIIRAISFLIRSRTWATFAPSLADLTIDESPDSFTVTYRATVRDTDAALDYTARIAGSGDGTLRFACAIEARTDFETARAGFVVLHAASVAGLPVRIEHADGRMVDGAFPVLIDPVQPMLNLRALTHEPAAGLVVTCRMDGDVFEMEDQRNWTDASFKTYVRPLSRPWPYTLQAGSQTEQSVTLSVAGPAPSPPRSATAEPIDIAQGEAIGPMPTIALGCTPREARAALPHAKLLATSGVPVLVCRFDPGQGHEAADLLAFRSLAAACEAEIELQVVVHSIDAYAAELQGTADAARQAGLTPRAVTVSPAPDLKSVTPGQPWPDCAPLAELYRAARAAFPGVPLGGGTLAYFTELNRKRPDPALLDFLTFSTSPIVHAADDLSVMESLEALPAVIASVRAIAGEKPFAVGPSAIGFRDNPYGAAPLDNARGIRQPMSGADPRQRDQFNAAWTLGYIARFAAGGAARVAVSAPVGPFGIVDGDGAFPVLTVIQGCAALRGATVHAAPASCERDVLALLAVQPDWRELWLANLTPESRMVRLPASFRGAEMLRLDHEGARHERCHETVRLGAYSVARCRVGFRV